VTGCRIWNLCGDKTTLTIICVVYTVDNYIKSKGDHFPDRSRAAHTREGGANHKRIPVAKKGAMQHLPAREQGTSGGRCKLGKQ